MLTSFGFPKLRFRMASLALTPCTFGLRRNKFQVIRKTSWAIFKAIFLQKARVMIVLVREGGNPFISAQKEVKACTEMVTAAVAKVEGKKTLKCAEEASI